MCFRNLLYFCGAQQMQPKFLILNIYAEFNENSLMQKWSVSWYFHAICFQIGRYVRNAAVSVFLQYFITAGSGFISIYWYLSTVTLDLT